MKAPQSEIIYQNSNKTVAVKLNAESLWAESLWLDAHKIAKIFDVDRTVLVKHLQN